jgi:hypothetical protein
MQGIQVQTIARLLLNPHSTAFHTSMLLCFFAGRDVCFAGDTVVQVRDDTGRAVPTKIKHVKTGQHILCTDTNEDLRLPTKASWCELMNWVSETLLRRSWLLGFAHT